MASWDQPYDAFAIGNDIGATRMFLLSADWRVGPRHGPSGHGSREIKTCRFITLLNWYKGLRQRSGPGTARCELSRAGVSCGGGSAPERESQGREIFEMDDEVRGPAEESWSSAAKTDRVAMQSGELRVRS